MLGAPHYNRPQVSKAISCPCIDCMILLGVTPFCKTLQERRHLHHTCEHSSSSTNYNNDAQGNDVQLQIARLLLRQSLLLRLLQARWRCTCPTAAAALVFAHFECPLKTCPVFVYLGCQGRCYWCQRARAVLATYGVYLGTRMELCTLSLSYPSIPGGARGWMRGKIKVKIKNIFFLYKALIELTLRWLPSPGRKAAYNWCLNNHLRLDARKVALAPKVVRVLHTFHL